MNALLLYAPADFASDGKAWIEAITSVLNLGIANFGVLALAGLAVYQNIKSKVLAEKLDEANRRLDRQSERITEVALAVPAVPAEVKINQPANEPIPVKETQP